MFSVALSRLLQPFPSVNKGYYLFFSKLLFDAQTAAVIKKHTRTHISEIL